MKEIFCLNIIRAAKWGIHHHSARSFFLWGWVGGFALHFQDLVSGWLWFCRKHENSRNISSLTDAAGNLAVLLRYFPGHRLLPLRRQICIFWLSLFDSLFERRVSSASPHTIICSCAGGERGGLFSFLFCFCFLKRYLMKERMRGACNCFKGSSSMGFLVS